MTDPPPFDPQNPGDPQYPPPERPRPSPAGPPPGPQATGQPLAPDPVSTSARTGLAGRLGPRALRRPEPRFGISLAAVGVVLVVGGMLVWGGGYLASGLHLSFAVNQEGVSGSSFTTNGEDRRFFGAVLFLLLTVVGYALVILRRTGPLATFGAVAAAVGVPLAIAFVSFDLTGTFSSGFPFSVDAIYLVSILAWLISYFGVPGARGRSFFLGAAAAGFAAYIALKAAGDSLLRTAVGTAIGSGFGSSGTGSLAAVGLIFGLAYYGIAAFLDRRGRAGAAVAMVYAGFVTTLGGIAGAIPDFKQVGTGVLLIVLGAGLSWYGARFGRRFTTWVWMAALLIGVGLIVAKAVPDTYTGAGITLIIVGLVVAALAQAVATASNEAPDIVDG